LIGILALALLFGAGVFWLWPPTGDSGWLAQLEAACWRLGPLLVVLWLAFPDLHRVPAWLWPSLLILLLILSRWPRAFLLAVPLLVALAILQPRIGRRT